MDGRAEAAMLRAPVAGSQAWTGATLRPADWVVPLAPDCLGELRAALADIRRSPLPLLLLDPRDFALDACRALMARVRRILDEGIMFAVLDRLPIEEMSREEGVKLYWLLASLLARPVAQKFDGTILYEVRDTGAKLKPGSGIRPTVTNVDLTFHNDNSYNEVPPDYVALFCQQKAKAGGISRVMSVYTIHNQLLAGSPELLERLYRPFWYDRHAEHAPGDPTTFAAPVFEYERGLKGRFALLEIRAGYTLRGEAIDPPGAAALAAIEGVFSRPELRVELAFEPGQIQIVNNRTTGHARTEFVDHPEAERKRHLVRLWLRDHGKRGYRG
ncbi:MAG: TauD/TfdA family dioxygenase [Alphaproteobacteria bacterium]|nr:TauD/TfdA family dioxygenase [Alphaproteobacteria bacterium]